MDKIELKNRLMEQSSSFEEDVRCKLEELNGNDVNPEDAYTSSVDMLASDEYQEFFEENDTEDDDFINIPDYPNEKIIIEPKNLTLADKIALLRGINIPDEYVRKK